MKSFVGLTLMVAALTTGALSAQDSAPGTVIGSVLDSQTGASVAQAKIEVEGHPDKTTTSDTDGKFKLTLPAGTYKLRFTQDKYATTMVTDVIVDAGGFTEASTVMVTKGAVTTVDVVEKVGAVASTAEAAMSERRLAAAVSDTIAAEDIRKSVASDAAGAVQKVTGVSIVENGYVYVRGLGERYSSTMLNNSLIPTTEPEKRVVPLDLFPAQLIENIRILKTFTPDLPGEFSGGVVQMSTVEFPVQKLFRVSTSFGFNTVTTGSRFLTYPGGGRDYFGVDDGNRQLPGQIPTDKRLFPGSYTQQEFQNFGRSFADNWEPTPIESMRPTNSLSAVAGGTFGRLGLVGALTFTNRPQYQSELQRYLRQEGTRPIIFTEYSDFRGYTESARLGGVLNAALRLNAANKLIFRNTLTRDTDKEARQFGGYDGGVDTTIQSERLRWIERTLLSSGVEGEHSLPQFGNHLLRWQFTYSKSVRDEPDLREVIRGLTPDGRYVFASLSNSGQRFFNNLEDRIYEPQAEYGIPFYKGGMSGLFKVGFRGTFRNRDFQARRFRYIPIRASTLDLYLPSNQLFAPQNIRPDGFQLTEFTRATDTYNAAMDIYAGYAMVDMALGTRWRLVGGIRVEDADIRVTTLDPLVPNGQPQIASLVNRDPTPGINVIYALRPRQNLRLSYSRTLSRPDFRELSPFDFNNVQGGFVAQGNPNLLRATVQNVDARWEWFLGGNQVVAASFFLKDFRDPIEVTILPANDLRETYVNAKGALNYGLELEARKSLGFISNRLRSFSVQSNLTLVDSNIDIREQDATLLTSASRPLLGQSRYIFNAIVEWTKPNWRSTSRFYANTVSRRLTGVGTFGLPDIYQERNTFLDFVYQYDILESGRWSLRFNAENLGDNQYRWTQGDITQRAYKLGRTFTVGTSFSIF